MSSQRKNVSDGQEQPKNDCEYSESVNAPPPAIRLVGPPAARSPAPPAVYRSAPPPAAWRPPSTVGIEDKHENDCQPSHGEEDDAKFAEPLPRRVGTKPETILNNSSRPREIVNGGEPLISNLPTRVANPPANCPIAVPSNRTYLPSRVTIYDASTARNAPGRRESSTFSEPNATRLPALRPSLPMHASPPVRLSTEPYASRGQTDRSFLPMAPYPLVRYIGGEDRNVARSPPHNRGNQVAEDLKELKAMIIQYERGRKENEKLWKEIIVKVNERHDDSDASEEEFLEEFPDGWE